jgi:hypothetical protein
MSVLNGSAPKSNSRHATPERQERARIVNHNGRGWVLNLLLWCRDVKATTAERDLLFTLASFCDHYAETFVGVETLAAKLDKTARQVQRLLRRLEKLGHIETINRSRRDPKTGKWTGSNLYRLNAYGANRVTFSAPPDDILSPHRVTFDGTNEGLKCHPKSPSKSPSIRIHIEDSLRENDRDSFKGPVEDTGQSESATGPNSSQPSGTGLNGVNGGGAWPTNPRRPALRSVKCPVCGMADILGEHEEHKCPGPRAVQDVDRAAQADEIPF